ncbi:hypothetical protein [Mesorhizobium sp.]|uniref:hypothetical protein n=1 Tax=Mesorhizobium sp. TaxID=1871066 RepID=UPI0025F8D2C9|nr:hypothetical protein [Mesorhizobium sp.]
MRWYDSPMGEFFDQLQKLWPLIMQAAWAFAAFGASLLVLGFVFGRFAFGERIANLESRLETRTEKIADLEAQLREKDKQLVKPRFATRPSPLVLPFSAIEPEIAKSPPAQAKITAGIGNPDTPKDRLIRQRWIFYFSPSGNNGSKNMTFLPDGTIGEGRNENEYRWVFEGDLLVLYRRNGDVQNSFRYNPGSGRFEYLPDSRAQGFKDQYLQPR